MPYQYDIVGKMPELKCVDAKYYCKPMPKIIEQGLSILDIRMPNTILKGRLNFECYFADRLHWLFQTSFSTN